jgi:uncharacterized membrane protein
MESYSLHLIPLTWLLTGAILVLTAALLRYKPPRNINRLYGYRTPRSMRSREAWDFAQQQSARLMGRSGAMLFLTGAAWLFIPPFEIWAELIIALGGVFLALFRPIIRIEKMLKEREEKEKEK